MNKRLLFKYVQSRPRNFLRFECVHQSRFVHHRAARSVDQIRGGSHAKQFWCVNHLPRISVERHMQSDKIRFRQQSIQVPIFRAQLCLDFVRGARLAVVNHFHTKPSGAARDGTPNTAESDYAQGLAPDVGAAELIKVKALPISRAYILVSFHNSARDGQEQCPSKIGSRFVEHAGSVRYHYSALGTRWQINIVIANGDICHETKLWSGPKYLVTNALGQETNQTILIFQAGEKFFTLRAFLFAPKFAFATTLQKVSRIGIEWMSGEHLGLRHIDPRETRSL